MRQWQAQPAGGPSAAAIGGMVRALAQPEFQARVLDELQHVLPAASWSVYRTGVQCRPTLFMSASLRIPDRTRECWWAYLSGPYRQDRSFGANAPAEWHTPRLCHITAQEIPLEHRVRVYEAHGMRERVSVVEQDGDALFAVNLYRHEHQAAFTDSQIASFESVAVPLLELARKHITLTAPGARAVPPAQREAQTPQSVAAASPAGLLRERLMALNSDLTPRELDVCVLLAQGMTHDGVAANLGLGLTTVKTYRNRAFARLGIHFRNELFARVLRLSPP